MGAKQAYDPKAHSVVLLHRLGTDVEAVDRTKYSRMGWSDISISMTGPIVNSTVLHFTDRWSVMQLNEAQAKALCNTD